MAGVTRKMAQRIAKHYGHQVHEIVDVAVKKGLYWVRFGDGERQQGAIRYLPK